MGLLGGCGLGEASRCPNPPAQPEAIPNGRVASAEEVTAAVRRAYQESKSYRDMGELTITRYKTGSSLVNSSRFQTLFVRGRGFRFAYDPVHGASAARFTLVSFGGKAFELSPTRLREPVDLGRKLSSKVGVSSGTSDLIPRLLFGGAPDGGPLHSGCKARGQDVEIRGDSCFQILCGAPGDKQTTRVAVRKRDLVVRSIEHYIDHSSDPKYQGSTDFSDPDAQRAYARNPLPLPDDIGMRQLVIFHAELNGPVGDVELEIPDEDDVEP